MGGKGSKSGSLAAASNKLSALNIQVSTYGGVIPWLWGSNRIAGRLIGYFDFTAIPLPSGGKKGGKGGGGTKKGGAQTQYTYTATVEVLLCMGQVFSIGSIWDSSGHLLYTVSSYQYTVPGGGGSVTPPLSGAKFLDDIGPTRGDSYSVVANDYGSDGSVTLSGTQQTPMTSVGSSPGAGQYVVNTTTGQYTFSAADAGKVVTINYSVTIVTSQGVSSPKEVLQLTLFTGAIGQAAWSYMVSAHPSQADSYSGIAYFGAENADLGQSGVLPNLTYEVHGLGCYTNGSGYDAQPSDIAYAILTDTINGIGWSSSLVGSLTQWINYFKANGLWLSPFYDSQDTAAKMVQDLCDMTNTAPVWSEGVLKFIPYGDTTVVGNGATYTPATNPIFDLNDDDYQSVGDDPVTISRTTQADAYNSVSIEFLNRANNYNPEVYEAKDDASIQVFGVRKKDAQAYHGITVKAVAQFMAKAQLNRELYIRSTYKWRAGWLQVMVECMDLVTLTDTTLGLNKTPVRVTKITENEDGTLDFEAEEFPWGTAQATVYGAQSAAGYAPNGYADPGSVNAPIIVEVNDRISVSGRHELWFAVSGNSLGNWGGCNVWASADGTTYKYIGKVQGSAAMGTLGADLPYAADPDNSSTLTLNVDSNTGVTLASVSAGDKDNYRSLIFLQDASGNIEIVSYQNATLVSSNVYNLTNLRRGVYNTPITKHSSGTTNWFAVNPNLFVVAVDAQWVGQTMHFKFTSFNQVEKMEQDISTVTDYTFGVVGNFNGNVYNPSLTDFAAAYNTGDTSNTNKPAIWLSWAAFTLPRPGDTPIPVASNASMPVPTLNSGDLGHVAGGTRSGPTTLYARTAYIKNGLLVGISGAQSHSVPANNLLTIASPAVPAQNIYDGWIPLVGGTATAVFPQGPTTPIAFGTNYTEPTSHYMTGLTSYACWNSQTVVVCCCTAAGAALSYSTHYYFYAWFNPNAPAALVEFSAPSLTPFNQTNGIPSFDTGMFPLTTGGGIDTVTGILGGSGSGGGDPNCPDAETWLTDSIQAKDCAVGTLLDCLSDDFSEVEQHPVEWCRESWEICYHLTAENGAEKIVSGSTPVPTRENLADLCAPAYASNVREGTVLTDIGNGPEWSPLKSVTCVGKRKVVRVYVGGRNFAGGVHRGKRIFTHNNKVGVK